MSKTLSLIERCKIAVWMEYLQNANSVQLKYEEEFGGEPPTLSSIKTIHNLFMTTGCVFSDKSQHKSGDEGSSVCIKKKIKVNSNERITLDEFKGEDDLELVKDIGLYSDEVDIGDLVSVLGEEIPLNDEEEYAQISVNEIDDENAGCNPQSILEYKSKPENLFDVHEKPSRSGDFFRCNLCSFTSNNTSLFRKHKKSCSNMNKDSKNTLSRKLNVIMDTNCHTCNECGKAYSSSASLKMHQAYHSKLRPFVCHVCQYRFVTETTLKKHLMTHDKIKHLECPHCSFKCNMSGTMIIHSRTHSGEKPYKCPDCNYRTGNPSVFKSHISAHRNDTKCFKCSQCSYTASKQTLLNNHEKKHMTNLKFDCHLCQKELKSPHALKYHMTKKHAEQEILECPFCDFCQKDKTLLNVHIRRHTGEKPYACSEPDCGYRAIRSQDLRKHQKSEHRTQE